MRRHEYALVLAVTAVSISLAGSIAIYGSADAGQMAVLNPQSYPLVGGEWTVRLAVAGTGGLTVSAVNGTTLAPYDPWRAVLHGHRPLPGGGLDPSYDLEFVRMRGAGGAVMAPSYQHGGSVAFEDFAGGNFTVLVHTPGAHHLKFEFEGAVAYADNTASLVRISSTNDDGTYVPGDAVNITATFSEAVSVETAGIVEEEGRFNTLNSPHYITTAVVDERTYALVASATDDGVQIIDITDPANPTATASVTDGEGCDPSDPAKVCFDVLDGAYAVTAAVIGERTYALVASALDDGVQIIDITDPANPTATASVTDGEGCDRSDPARACFDVLNGAHSITTAVIGERTYALVASNVDDGVQIIDITDPANPVATASATDGENGFDKLWDVHHITTIVVDEKTYALVTSTRGAGVQIINVTDPANPTATASVIDGQGCDPSDPAKVCFDELYTAYSITAVVIDEMTYALVASKYDDGVQIINVTDPANPVATASVTDGENGFDKIKDGHSITTAVVDERTYALVAGRHADGVQIIDITDPANPVATASVSDNMDGFSKLDGAYAVTAVAIGERIYALATSYYDDGVQIIDITDPANPVATASVSDDRGGFDKLDGASSVTTAVISGKTYALVASMDEDRDFVSGGIQIMDVTDPASPAATASVTDGEDGFGRLDGAYAVTTVTIGERTYALAAGRHDDGVQIIDITNPASPAAIASVTDGNGGFVELGGVSAVTTAVIGERTYALAAGYHDDGVQIIDITDPASPAATASVTDGKNGFDELDGAYSVTTAVIGERTYALVAGRHDDGVQIINVTDPASPVATASVTDGKNGFDELDGARSVATAVIGERTYALVASSFDDGVQIIDITDPASPVATASVTDGKNGFDELDGARSVATAVIGERTYALVAGYRDDGVQIIDITDPASPDATASVTDGKNGFDELDGARSVATAVIGERTYALVAGYHDDGVQIIDISDPASPVAVDSRPYIALDVMPADRRAVYVAGSETTTLTFEYVVQEGDSTPHLKYTDTDALVVPSLSKIRDQDSSAVIIPKLPIPGQSNSLSANNTIVIAATRPDISPTVMSIERNDPTDQATDSQTLVFAVTFSEPVTGVDLDDFAFSPDAIREPEQFTHTRTLSMPIPDAGAAISDTITAADPGLATSVSVGVDITHTFIGDLVVDLVAPGGTTMSLHNRTGEHADNIDRTYTPDFDGTEIAGDWVLRVSDEYRDDTGTLNGWALAIEYEDTSAVTGLNGSGTRYLVTVSATINGTYNLDIVPNSGIADMTGNPLNGTIPTGEDQSYIVNTSFILNTPSNNPPQIDAGPDQTVLEGVALILNGTASDPDPGDRLTYSWSHNSTLDITLSNQTALSTTFTAPQVDSNSTIVFTLTAGDPHNATASDTMTVTVLDIPDSIPPPSSNTVVLEPDGTLGPYDIGRITLTSSATGIIQAAWEEPDEKPANYRISWARVGQPYPTWTDLTGNAFPTVPSQTIIGFEEGAEYKVRVRASYDGTAGDWSGEVTITAAGTAVNTPAAGSPAIGGTVQVGQALTANISGITDADGMTNSTLSYQWVSNDGATDADIAGATASRHVLTAGDQGRTIKVRVAFTDDAGHAESLTSAATQAVAPAHTAPGSPQDLAVSTNGSGTLAVSWQAPASDGGRSITGYTVQWKAASGSWDLSSDVSEVTTTGTTHTITGLTDGTPYAVRVLATNDVGDGEPTPEETATPQVPVPPLGPRDIGTVTLGSTAPGIIEASWEEPDEEPANYRVMWTKVGEPYLTWTDSSGNAFPTGITQTITGLEDGETYKLKVRASYDGTAGDWSGEATVTVASSASNQPTATVPGAPTGLSVSPNGTGALAVSWQAPASNGGSNLTGYTVQWKKSTGSWDSSSDVSEVTTAGTAHTITGLTDGTSYAVRVLATNGIGDGEPTSEETATPQAPAPPRGPRDIGRVTLSSATPGTIQVSWDAPDEEPANYRVMWAKVGEPYLTWTDSTGNAFPIVPSHTITGLEEGVEYKLKVRASYDGTAGDWSGEATVTVARTG